MDYEGQFGWRGQIYAKLCYYAIAEVNQPQAHLGVQQMIG
jgi:hypothetical protein